MKLPKYQKFTDFPMSKTPNWMKRFHLDGRYRTKSGTTRYLVAARYPLLGPYSHSRQYYLVNRPDLRDKDFIVVDSTYSWRRYIITGDNHKQYFSE